MLKSKDLFPSNAMADDIEDSDYRYREDFRSPFYSIKKHGFLGTCDLCGYDVHYLQEFVSDSYSIRHYTCVEQFKKSTLAKLIRRIRIESLKFKNSHANVYYINVNC